MTSASVYQKAYRAVILTALPVEYNAVRSHLTEVREDVHRQGTIYERGWFSGPNGKRWDVIIARVGVGNIAAAAEAERAIGRYEPSAILFVGVAGGIKDVAIGDVVVATRVYFYESGKAEASFKSRPNVGVPTYPIVQRAGFEATRTEWLNRIKGTQPVHTARVLLAPIAAGEKVVASTRADLYKFLRSYYGDAVAVEMEGAGLLHAAHMNPQTEALIVRGISDLIDDKARSDAKGSQITAANNASAFAFQVLAKLDWMLSAIGSPAQMELEDLARLRDRATEIVCRYFGFDAIEVREGGIEWFDFASTGERTEFYALYRQGDRQFLDVFTTKRGPELLYHARADTLGHLGADLVRTESSIVLVSSSKHGSGGYLDVELYTYDGIGKPKLVYEERNLFQGRLFLADNKIYLGGSGQRFEVRYDEGEFRRFPYAARPLFGRSTSIHVLSIDVTDDRLSVRYDGFPLPFVEDPRTNTMVTTSLLDISPDEQIVIDDAGPPGSAIRVLVEGEHLGFDSAFFVSIKPESLGDSYISISHGYRKWYRLNVKIANRPPFS